MYILTEYLDQAMAQAVYEKLDDGKYGGRIPTCPGVVAFAASLGECSEDLRSTLEDWVLLGMKLAHPLPARSAASISTGSRDFIRVLGFDGPLAGTRHFFMIRESQARHPIQHRILREEVRMMLAEVEVILGRSFSADEWSSL